jgi:hypothetical protein
MVNGLQSSVLRAVILGCGQLLRPRAPKLGVSPILRTPLGACALQLYRLPVLPALKKVNTSWLKNKEVLARFCFKACIAT